MSHLPKLVLLLGFLSAAVVLAVHNRDTMAGICIFILLLCLFASDGDDDEDDEPAHTLITVEFLTGMDETLRTINNMTSMVFSDLSQFVYGKHDYVPWSIEIDYVEYVIRHIHAIVNDDQITYQVPCDPTEEDDHEQGQEA